MCRKEGRNVARRRYSNPTSIALRCAVDQPLSHTAGRLIMEVGLGARTWPFPLCSSSTPKSQPCRTPSSMSSGWRTSYRARRSGCAPGWPWFRRIAGLHAPIAARTQLAKQLAAADSETCGIAADEIPRLLLQDVLLDIGKRDPCQPEFLQAVLEVRRRRRAATAASIAAIAGWLSSCACRRPPAPMPSSPGPQQERRRNQSAVTQPGPRPHSCRWPPPWSRSLPGSRSCCPSFSAWRSRSAWSCSGGSGEGGAGEGLLLR